MKSVKMVLIKEHGVLGYIIYENNYGARVQWYLDGLRYESYLESDEYVIKFIGEIDVE